MVTAAIYGLHGLPLPRASPLVRTESGPAVANVTPTVIYDTYSVTAYSVDRKGTNLQAVAEFQGQYMNKSDLAAFFKAEVYGWSRGDDRVSKFVGAPYARHEKAGLEAMLDVEYLMGVATGIVPYDIATTVVTTVTVGTGSGSPGTSPQPALITEDSPAGCHRRGAHSILGVPRERLLRRPVELHFDPAER